MSNRNKICGFHEKPHRGTPAYFWKELSSQRSRDVERRQGQYGPVYVCKVTAYLTQKKLNDALSLVTESDPSGMFLRKEVVLLRLLPKCSETRYKHVKQELECFPIPVTFGETVARRAFRKEIMEALRR